MKSSSSSSKKRVHKLGRLDLAIPKSVNPKTKNRLVWAARRSCGVPVLVHVSKPVSKEEFRK